MICTPLMLTFACQVCGQSPVERDGKMHVVEGGEEGLRVYCEGCCVVCGKEKKST